MRSFRLTIQPPPVRSTIPIAAKDLVSLVMQEHAAVWAEIHTSLANQVSILSFGAATLGLLVAAAAQLWIVAPVVAGFGLLVAAPAACFLALAVYLGEQVRLMRAGLFLYRLEETVNSSAHRAQDPVPAARDSALLVLTWEQWVSIHERRRDVDRHNRWVIVMIFTLLAVGSAAAGYARLHTAPSLNEHWATAALTGLAVPVILSTAWLTHLMNYSNRYRNEYVGGPPPPANPGG